MKKTTLSLLLLLIVIVFPKITQAQLIYTYGGTGTAGYSGDGGSSNAATLNQPLNVAVDTAGNIYIADFANNVIRKISTTGIIITVAGNNIAGYSGDGGNATAAMLNGPSGIAVDIAGNIYIADQLNNRIRKVSTAGIISTIAGDGTAGYTGDNGISTSAEINSPWGVAVDDTGSIYIADYGNNVVREIDTFGQITTFAGNGTPGYSGNGSPATTAQLHSPTGVATGPSGVYVADDSNNVVRKVNGSGIISTVAGNGTPGFSGDAGVATSAKLNSPIGISVDASGNIYIADENNNRIRKVNGAGNINTIAGNGTPGYSGDGGSATSGEMNTPKSIVGYGSNLYVADYGNNVIRIITSDIAPAFMEGPAQTMVLCEDSSISLDNMLSIVDPDAGQTETWQIISGPGHGIVTGFPYSATSNGDVLIPAGLSYTPTSGYSGTDVLTFQVSDGAAVSITTISTTINPTPDVIDPSDQVICKGSTTVPVVFTGSVTGTTYAWTNSNTSIGLGAGGSGNIGAFTGANSTSAAITGTITVTPSANSCMGIPQKFSITVNPAPNVAVVSNQTLCNGANTTAVNFSGTVSGTTYTWANNNTSIGLANSGTGNITSFTVANTGTVTAVATITVTPTANGCTGTSRTFTISVRPTPTVNTPSNQTVCNGAATSAVTFTGAVGSTTYAWTNNNTSIGLAANGNGNIASFTASNSSSVAVTATITVTPSAGSCSGTPQSFTIIVNPSPNTIISPASQAVCNGATTTPVNFSSSVSGTTYTWVNNNTSIGLVNSGAGNIASFTAVNTGSAVQIATISVTPSANGCVSSAQNFTITVNPIPDVAAPSNQTLCSGEVTTPVNFTGAVGGTTYTWVNNNTSIGLATSGTGNITPFTATNSTNVAITATVTVTPTANGCTGSSQDFMITVKPTPDITVPSNQTVCNGATTIAANFSSSTSGATFAWTNSNSGIGLASSGTGNIASFMATNGSSAAVTATITATSSANGCTSIPQTFTISVDPTPDVATPGNQTLCNGAATASVNFTGSVSGTAFSWVNNNTNIGLGASGNGDITSFTTTNSTNVAITATITVTPFASGCNGASKSFMITVNPTPDIIPSSSQTVCNGTGTAPINFSSSVSGATYNWANSNSSIGLASSGTGNIASFTAINSSSATVTSTINAMASANGCVSSSQNISININPTPDMVVPVNQSLCNGAATTPTNFSSSVAGTTYTWVNNNTSIGLAAAGNGDIASFTADNSTSAAVTATITVTPSANGCIGTAQNFMITVNPIPDVTIPANQTLCNGAATTAVNFTGSASGTNYSWVNNNVNIGLAANGAGDIPAFTATNSTNTAITATITVTPMVNSCTGSSQSFMITVKPTPDIITPSNQTVCNGATTAPVSFSSSVSGATYTWTNNNSSIGLASSGTGDISSFIAINSSDIMVMATITATPSANGCVGTSQDFAITVNPTPDVAVPASQVLCNGAATTAVNFTGSASGTTYGWVNNNTGIGLSSSGNGDIASFVATNNTNVAMVATITVTPSANTCTGTPQLFTITVKPTPNVVTPSNQVLCNGETTTAVNFSGNVGGTTYAWSNSNTSTGLAASGNGNITPFTATNIGNTAITSTITVTPSALGCAGISQNFTIIVNPGPDIVIVPGNETVCNGSTTTAINFSSSSSGATFNWVNNNASIGLATSGNGDIPSFTTMNATNVAVTATITVTSSVGSCIGVPQNFMIIVNPTPFVSIPINQIICNGAVTSAVNFNNTVSGTTYDWNNNNTAIGLAASGIGNISPFTVTNTGSAAITATITVTPAANGCTGNSQNFTITANPTPVLSTTLTPPAICDSTLFTYVPASATEGTIFTWNRAAITGISTPTANGTGDISEVLDNMTTAPIAAVYVYTLSVNSCENIQDVTVMVNPKPILNSPLTASPICDSAVFSYIPLSNVTGAAFNWYRPSVAGIAATPASGTDNPNEQLVNTTNFDLGVTYIYTVTANNCAFVQNVAVDVHPTPSLSSLLTSATCNKESFRYIPSSFTPTTTFAWSRPYVPGITPATASGIDSINEVLVNNTSAPLNAVYIYTLNIAGCTHVQNLMVTLNTNPTPVPLTTTSPTSVCANTLAQNFGTSVAPTSGSSYSWSAVNATITTIGSNGQYSLIDFPTPGNAWIILTTKQTTNGCSGSDSFEVKVGPDYADDPAEVVYFNHNFIALQNNEEGYQWGYDNAVMFNPTVIQGAIDQNYSNDNPDFTDDLYWVKVQHHGCVQKSYYNVHTGAVAKSSETSVTIFPNPADEKINVEVSTSSIANMKVEILNIAGQKINEVPTTNNRANIDVAGLPAGCYMVNCYRDGIRIAAAKFIKN